MANFRFSIAGSAIKLTNNRTVNKWGISCFPVWHGEWHKTNASEMHMLKLFAFSFYTFFGNSDMVHLIAMVQQGQSKQCGNIECRNAIEFEFKCDAHYCVPSSSHNALTVVCPFVAVDTNFIGFSLRGGYRKLRSFKIYSIVVSINRSH